MKADPKLMMLATVFVFLVACQTMFLGQLASPGNTLPPSSSQEDCKMAEQPPWVDEEFNEDPCPIKGRRHPA